MPRPWSPHGRSILERRLDVGTAPLLNPSSAAVSPARNRHDAYREPFVPVSILAHDHVLVDPPVVANGACDETPRREEPSPCRCHADATRAAMQGWVWFGRDGHTGAGQISQRGPTTHTRNKRRKGAIPMGFISKGRAGRWNRGCDFGARLRVAIARATGSNCSAEPLNRRVALELDSSACEGQPDSPFNWELVSSYANLRASRCRPRLGEQCAN